MSVHVSHITSCAGNAMYQKSPNHSTLTYPNYLPVRFKTRKCPHHTPTGPAASSSSQNSPRGSQPLTAQLTLPSLWTLWGGHTLAFKITLKCSIATDGAPILHCPSTYTDPQCSREIKREDYRIPEDPEIPGQKSCRLCCGKSGKIHLFDIIQEYTLF